MAETCDVVLEDPRWTNLGLEDLAERAVAATLSHLSAVGEVAVLACDDTRIAALNADFRGKPQATNVLSWPSEERGAVRDGDRPRPAHDPELGDIAIAYDTCAREAADAARPVADHARHLIVHATLHLLGYDHERPADGDLMERLEAEILAKFGQSDPYCG